MRYVVVVSGASSAVLIVEETRMRGYQPILVNPPHRYSQLNDLFNAAVGNFDPTFNLKSEDEYEDLIKNLKKYDIVCVVAGGDGGVEYAERIAADLGLPGNDPKTTWRRVTKEGMHSSLKDANLRYNLYTVVKSNDDIRKFWKENNISKGFMKYSRGAASVLNKAVTSVDEAIKYYQFLKKNTNIYGKENKNDILLQEFIGGNEYIIDTVSCDGKHMITDIWKYSKTITSNGNVASDYKRLVTTLEPEVADIIPYVYKVLDAVGVRYGPCHGEFKIDEKGPILIETNVRFIGMNMDAKYLDEILGYNLADIALDSYLNKAEFEKWARSGYRPRKHSLHKYCIMPKNTKANPYPLKVILNRFKSFRQCLPEIKNEITNFVTTDGLETAPFSIKLNHEDWATVEHELNILRMLENDYFDLIYSKPGDIPYIPVKTDYESLCDDELKINKVLTVTNDGNYLTYLGKKKKISDIATEVFDDLVYAFTEKMPLGERMEKLMSTLSLVRGNGRIFIIPEAYEGFPYGAAAITLMLDVADCNVRIPNADSKGIITAIKK